MNGCSFAQQPFFILFVKFSINLVFTSSFFFIIVLVDVTEGLLTAIQKRKENI